MSFSTLAITCWEPKVGDMIRHITLEKYALSSQSISGFVRGENDLAIKLLLFIYFYRVEY